MTTDELRTTLAALDPPLPSGDLEILTTLFETRSSHVTASRLGITQGRVIHRSLRAVVMHGVVATLVGMPWMRATSV